MVISDRMSAHRVKRLWTSEEILELNKAFDDEKVFFFFPSFPPFLSPSLPFFSFFSPLFFYFLFMGWRNGTFPIFLLRLNEVWYLHDLLVNVLKKCFATKLINQCWNNLFLGFTFHSLENKINFLHCCYQCALSLSTTKNIICLLSNYVRLQAAP